MRLELKGLALTSPDILGGSGIVSGLRDAAFRVSGPLGHVQLASGL